MNFKPFLRITLLLAILFSIIFVFRVRLENIKTQFLMNYFPCQYPISYTIGSFDSRFDIARNDFLDAISQAEKIWEAPLGKKLFEYKTGGDLKINLVYDSRQEATDKLRALGYASDKNMSSYNELKARYNLLKSQYEEMKANYDAATSSYEIKASNYNQAVSDANRKGGADKKSFQELSAEKSNLESELASIKSIENSLKAKIAEINDVVSVLNKVAYELNITVDEYNQIGQTQGEEFQEGLYEIGPNGIKIDIYQYDDKNTLVRLLAHELGHALGLDHINNKDAIMYRLNSGENESLTADDLSAIKKHCGIKK